MSLQRDILNYFDNNPKIESICEIFIIIIVSLGPLFLASFSSMLWNPNFRAEEFSGNFFSYLSAGELSLLIVSLCGGIVWTTFIRDNSSSILRKTLYCIFAVLVAPGICAVIIARNPGFDKTLPSWVFNLLILLYVASIIMWLLASIKAKSAAVEIAPGSERAKKILAEAKREGANGQN